MKGQTLANTEAAKHAGSLYGAIQPVLDSELGGVSAQSFAKSNGADLDRAFGSPSPDGVREQVTKTLEDLKRAPAAGGASTPGQNFLTSGADDAPPAPKIAGTGHSNVGQGLTQSGETVGAPAGVPAAVGEPRNLSAGGATSTPAIPPAPQNITSNPLASGGQTSLPGSGVSMGQGGSIGAPNISAGASQPSLPSTSAPTNALSPEGFAQNFNSGAQAGGPVSSGAEGLSNTAAHAMQPQTPLHPESMAAPPMAPTAPTAGAPLFETAHAAPTYDAGQAPVAPPADTTQAYVAAPAAQAPVMPSTAAPAAPQGPLPAYGADLRPPAATAPAAQPAMPTAASPGSAPVHPSAGTQLNQPAVVRQAPTAASTAASAPAGLTENAVAATTTGAMAGASAVVTQAQQRLNRLLDAVARQEPKLRWAIGDRDDVTTVLATDLASGWIPPQVEIPTGIKLLKPGNRAKTLDALLGETTLTAAYAPGQYLPPEEDAQPTQMSIRARDTADVEDLGWELAQATKWRDGLPRLAHTLAKAASTGTGYLDSEVELLREHLATVAGKVLGDYPDHVDTANVGNWQLLATIDALIKGEKTAANYHFAWFQALNLALKGEVHR